MSLLTLTRTVYGGNTIDLSTQLDADDTLATVAKVQGVTQLQGVAKSMRIAMFDRNTLATITSFWSSTVDGSFSYQVSPSYVGKNDVMVVVFDDTQTVNASVVDFIEPEVIT